MMDWIVAVALLVVWARLGNELGGWLREYDDRRRTARRCARGEHRETVVDVREWLPDPRTGLPGCYALETRVVLRCLDCPHVTPLYAGLVFTPQRRQKHGRAA